MISFFGNEINNLVNLAASNRDFPYNEKGIRKKDLV
jgi:hypothetical protein